MNKVFTILKEIEEVLDQIEEQHLHVLADKLKKSNRIFVVGEGRSGLMAKSFAMRLMHLGASVYVVGETITPSIKVGDVLVAVSGSGTTKAVTWTSEKAKSIGATIMAITTDINSPLAAVSDQILHVPAATKYRRENERETIQPLGSLFDQCAHVLFDTLCLFYSELNQINHQKAFKLHSNLE